MAIGIRPGAAAPPWASAIAPGEFEAQRAFEHVRQIAFPRRVGSSGEHRAARQILAAFAAMGLRRRRERFPVPLLAREVGIRLVFLATAGALVLGGMLLERHPLAAAACGILAAALVNTPWKPVGRIGWRWPTRVSSQNLVAEVPGLQWIEAPARVVFMAHYDTKSQVLPTGVRVALVVAITAIGLLLVTIGSLAASGWTLPLPDQAVGVLCGVGVVLLCVLVLNITGNRSPGALDNGTGIGTLLELARTWRPRPECPVEILWVATGAEEVGLDGARDLLRRYEGWCREKPTLLVNLDSIGAGDRVYLAGEPSALQLAARVADDLGLAWSRLRVPGAGTDHQPFADRGIAAVSILGDVVGCSLALHSRRDDLALVDIASLQRAGTLAAHLAWTWAERNQPAARVIAAVPEPGELLVSR